MAGGHGHGTTYKGVTLHQPKRWHTVTGKGMCAMMWKVLSADDEYRDEQLRMLTQLTVSVSAMECEAHEGTVAALLVQILRRFWILYRAKQDGPVVLVSINLSLELILELDGGILGKGMDMETNIRWTDDRKWA
ncbi:hypothetical protein Ccrd_017411 [Cynara cardunculus var. scolymus]|uniref:Uncharacterized protein n=1 Tax=Cynara cardunculus var. scolymus TaxID=59895 RepID=A0A103Y855_CYNCS|nr:hypothetical protein Ccrd_017411 [Cynara cardunculus var. scolymus]